jgi:ABC-type transport system involved in multi-copper enzyme maturation permease subunit
MYLWKAWHDCRARVILYTLAALSIGVLLGLEVEGWANFHAYFMMLPGVHRNQWFYFDDFYITFTALHQALGYYGTWMHAFYEPRWVALGYGPLAMLLAGLSLGASGVGKEYGAQTMNFVLSRPSQRRNFVLVDWVVGLTAVVIIPSALTFPLLPFLFSVHAKGPGNVLGGLPVLWVLGAAIYGLSYFTTLVTGSAAKGLTLSAAALLTYDFLPAALHEWWHTDLLLRAVEWTLRGLEDDAWPLSPFAWGSAVFWLALAAGLLGASLAWIRFREV